MFSHVDSRSTILPPKSETLQDSDEEQNDDSKYTDRLVGREQTYYGSRQTHYRYRQKEGILSPDHVANPAEDEGPERSSTEPGSKDSKVLDERLAKIRGGKELRC